MQSNKNARMGAQARCGREGSWTSETKRTQKKELPRSLSREPGQHGLTVFLEQPFLCIDEEDIVLQTAARGLVWLVGYSSWRKRREDPRALKPGLLSGSKMKS